MDTAQHATALVLSVSALVVSIAAALGAVTAWWFSRAGTASRRDAVIEERVSACEILMDQAKTAVTSIADEVMDSLTRVIRERKRVHMENERAARANNGGEPVVGASRSDFISNLRSQWHE